MRTPTFPILIEHRQVDAPDAAAARPSTLAVWWAGDAPVGQHLSGPRADALALRADLRRAERAAAALAMRPLPVTAPPSTASVIICTRDRPDALERCLRSFAAQTRRPDQLVVVDNASVDDRTRQVAQACGAQYVREDRPGLDIARNAGARAATGQVVAYTDDDVELHPRWLERLVAAFDAPEVWAVTGLVLPAELETEAQWRFEREWGFGRGFRRRDFGPEAYDSLRLYAFPAWMVGAGASMAFRRDVFDRVGLFDERLDVGAAGCSGDSEFWNRILHHGGTCRYEPVAAAFHHHRRDRPGLHRQIRAYMSGHVAALLVQYERTGEEGNLRRLTRTLPKHYVWKALTLPRGRTDPRVLFQEVRGIVDGVRFYRRAARPPDARRLPRNAGPPPAVRPVDGRMPVVGVVIPAYNAEATLDATLRSVRGQTYKHLRIVVVDDGSTDGTADLARGHAAQDERVVVVSQPNRGLAAARNRGVAACDTDFIAPVDADDLCHPEKFERQLAAFQRAGEGCALVYGWSELIDEADRIHARATPYLTEGFVLPDLLAGNFIGNGSSPMMRRGAVLACGGYDTTLRDAGAQGCEDLKLYLAIAEDHDFAVVPMPLTGYRLSRSSMSSDIGKMIRSHRLVVQPYAERFPEYEHAVRAGHVFLSLYYIQRAVRVGHWGRAATALRYIAAYDPKLCLKVPVALFVNSFRPRLWVRRAARRLGLARYELFPQSPKP